jgi:hypothetical protein
LITVHSEGFDNDTGRLSSNVRGPALTGFKNAIPLTALVPPSVRVPLPETLTVELPPLNEDDAS